MRYDRTDNEWAPSGLPNEPRAECYVFRLSELRCLRKARAVDLFIVVTEKTKNDQREIRGVRMGEHLARHDIKVEVNTSMAPDIDVASTSCPMPRRFWPPP